MTLQAMTRVQRSSPDYVPGRPKAGQQAAGGSGATSALQSVPPQHANSSMHRRRMRCIMQQALTTAAPVQLPQPAVPAARWLTGPPGKRRH